MTGGSGVEPIWIEAGLVIKLHDRQIEQHGGIAGIRDSSLLESALARPLNKWSYGETDLCALAAAYAFGLARNHPFSDGNKRTAWVLARLFLQVNGAQLRFTTQEAIDLMLALAAGEISEEEVVEWFRSHLAGAD